jgi:hypothetical protein
MGARARLYNLFRGQIFNRKCFLLNFKKYLGNMEIEDFECFYSVITCCLSEDRHLIRNAVLLECGGNACAKCTSSSFNCNHCKSVHASNRVITNTKTLIELLIQSNYSALIQHLNIQNENKQQAFISGKTFFLILCCLLTVHQTINFYLCQKS